MKTCDQCGSNFDERGYHSRFCSKECYRAYFKHPAPAKSAYPGVPNITVGAIGELRAAADLMANGYHVFRAVSANSPCDLIAMKGQLILRVEVKTGYKLKDGSYVLSGSPVAGQYDVIAIASGRAVIYKPSLEEIEGRE